MDVEALLAGKRLELEREKRALGLRPAPAPTTVTAEVQKSVDTVQRSTATNPNDNLAEKSTKACDAKPAVYRPGEPLPPELLKYLRRYTGLPPMMLKTGEFSPNNPLFRDCETDGHDVFPGLGAYEERKKRLRRLRQQEYKEYLDKQAKNTQRNTKEESNLVSPAEERINSPDYIIQSPDSEQQSSYCKRQSSDRIQQSSERMQQSSERSMKYMETQTSQHMVDSGTQCGGDLVRPASVAVQTDDAEIIKISTNLTNQLTQAERELSPRTVVEPATFTAKMSPDDRPIKPGLWTEDAGVRRRSCDQVNADHEPESKRSNRDKLMRDLRHTYLPSFLDADVIRQRNLKTEKEAAERRQFYQQELKSQILEQQRIREERKQREKLLEQAEMRRLEEQLRMLRVAQEREVEKNNRLSETMNECAATYDRKRNLMQKEIDVEKSRAFRSYSQPLQTKTTHSQLKTSNSDNFNRSAVSKLPFYYQNSGEFRDPESRQFQNALDNVLRINPPKEKPFSINISEKSLFSPNYDVDNYLRRNLNPSKEDRIFTYPDKLFKREYEPSFLRKNIDESNNHKDQNKYSNNYKNKYQSSSDNIDRENATNDDPLPIPVLRHSTKNSQYAVDISKTTPDSGENKHSEAMKTVEGKWQVPIVQKNIMRSLPSGDGKNKNILTQLGSIRRQLQLEQLKLDKMLGPSDLK